MRRELRVRFQGILPAFGAPERGDPYHQEARVREVSPGLQKHSFSPAFLLMKKCLEGMPPGGSGS